MSRLPDQKQGSDCQRWSLPELDESGAVGNGMGPLTAGEVEAIQQQAYEEGYELGRREGRDAGAQEMAESAGLLEQLLCSLSQPFADLDQEVEDGLVALSIAIARQLVRRELRSDPNQIVAVVREAVGVLPSAARRLRLHLHPEDARLVHELLPVPDGESGWEIIDDATLGRGGCLVSTETSQVDATVEARLNNVIAAVLGGEREEDDRQ
jgi:flagellar assembly protein FliH